MYLGGLLFHVISCYCMFNGNVSLWYRLKPWHAWQYSGIRRIHSEPAVLPKTPLRLAETESTWPKDLERFWWTSRQALNFPPNFPHFLDLQPSSNPEPWQPMAKWQRIQNLRVLSHLSRSATAAIPKLDSCQKKLVEKEKPGNLVPKKLFWSLIKVERTERVQLENTSSTHGPTGPTNKSHPFPNILDTPCSLGGSWWIKKMGSRMPPSDHIEPQISDGRAG